MTDFRSPAIDGLRSKFGTREAIVYFVDVYNAERKRASKAGRRQSIDLERKLGLAERDLKRAIEAMIRGTISEAEGDQIIPELRRQRDRVKAALESADKPPKVIGCTRRRSMSTCGQSKDWPTTPTAIWPKAIMSLHNPCAGSSTVSR
jgi:hypothetical protein